MQISSTAKILIRNKTLRQLIAELDDRLKNELGLLLKSALPNRDRSYQLAKLIKAERDEIDFNTAQTLVLEYFKIPFERRTSGQFWRTFQLKPYPWLHSQFILSFSNAHVSERTLMRIAGRFRHYLKLILDPPKQIGDIDFIYLAIYKMIHPVPGSFTSFDWASFLNAWRRASFQKYGERFESFFANLEDDLDAKIGALNTQEPISMGSEESDFNGHDLNLSQTDLDWMKEILEAIETRKSIPDYPLSRGPNKPATRQVERVVRIRKTLKRPESRKVLLLSLKDLCQRYLRVYGQLN